MSDCIDALIDQNLIDTIKAIDISDGYSTDFGTVERRRTNLCINERFPYTAVIQLEPDEVEQWANLQSSNLNYVIFFFDGYGDDNETEDGEFVYRMRNVHADIQKALRVDPTRGGYAQNTEVKTHGFDVYQDGHIELPCVYVVVEIHRILDPNDPYQLA